MFKQKISNSTEPETEKKYHFSVLSQITKGAGINFGGNLAGKIFLFFYTIFIAKTLGAKDLGLYYLGMSVATFISSISTIGLDAASVRFISLQSQANEIGKIKGTILASMAIAFLASLLSGTLLFLFAETISVRIFHKPDLVSVIKLFAITIPFSSITKIFLSSTRGLKIMKYTIYTNSFAEVIIRFSFTLLFLYGLGWKLQGLISAHIISSALCTFLAFYYANRHIPILNGHIVPSFELKNLLTYSVPLVFSRVFLILFATIDTLMLGYFSRAEDVGIYNIAIKLVTLAILIVPAFQTIYDPFVAEFHAKKELEKLSNLLKAASRWIFTICFPICLLLICFPDFFLNLFGNEFIQGSSCLIVLGIAYLIRSSFGLMDSMIYMSGRSDLLLKNTVSAAIINISLNYVLIPKYGIIGAAFATGISVVLLNLVRTAEVFYLMRIQPFRQDFWKPLSAGIISIAITFLLYDYIAFSKNYITFILLICIFTFLYLFLIYLFKFSEEDLYIKRALSNKLLSLIK